MANQTSQGAETIGSKQAKLTRWPWSREVSGEVPTLNAASSDASISLHASTSQNAQVAAEKKTANQSFIPLSPTPSEVGPDESPSNADASISRDSPIDPQASNEERAPPTDHSEMDAPRQPFLPLYPHPIKIVSITPPDSLSGPDTSDLPISPGRTNDEGQEQPHQPESTIPSQHPLPPSPIPHEGDESSLLSISDTKDTRTSPETMLSALEEDRALQNSPSRKRSSHSFLSIFPVRSKTDRVKSPKHNNIANDMTHPSIRKALTSPPKSSPSSSSSDSSGQATLRAPEPYLGKLVKGISDSVSDVIGAVSHPYVSNGLADPIKQDQEEPLRQPLDSGKTPLTPAEFQSEVVESNLPIEVESLTDLPRASSPDQYKPRKTLAKLAPLKTMELPSQEDSQSTPKSAVSSKHADRGSPLQTEQPSNNTDRRSSLKTIHSPGTVNRPASPTKAESSNNADLSVSVVRPNSLMATGEQSLPKEADHSDNAEALPLSRPMESAYNADIGSSCKPLGSQVDVEGSSKLSLDLTVDLGTLNEDPDTIKETREPRASDPEAENPSPFLENRKLPVPKIFVERASDATDIDIPWTAPSLPKVEEKRHYGKLEQGPIGVLSSRVSSTPRGVGGLHSPILPQIAENVEEPESPKIRKRNLYVRKARNIAARKVILKLALGRQLAEETKPALRRLAHGEPYGLGPSEQHFRVNVSVKTT